MQRQKWRGKKWDDKNLLCKEANENVEDDTNNKRRSKKMKGDDSKTKSKFKMN